MNKILFALGLSLAAATAAHADSGALDVRGAPPAVASAQGGIDYTATASIGDQTSYEHRAKLGDGSPVYDGAAGVNAAAASSGGVDLASQPRLGDGSPVYFN